MQRTCMLHVCTGGIFTLLVADLAMVTAAQTKRSVSRVALQWADLTTEQHYVRWGLQEFEASKYSILLYPKRTCTCWTWA